MNDTQLLAELQQRIIDNEIIADEVWLLRSSYLILSMQLGFMLVEVAFTRKKNVTDILTKNLADMAVGK